MDLFRFPVGSPYAVLIAPSRLISDTPQVVDYIHGERVESLQRLFDSYELPEEAYPVAMEQFAAVAGLTSIVSSNAVAKMRAMLRVAAVTRDTDPDDITLDWLRPPVARTLSWADELQLLTDRFKEAADLLEDLPSRTLRSERAIIALKTLGRLTQESKGRGEILLRCCESGYPANVEKYDLRPGDFSFFLRERDRFLDMFFHSIIQTLPQITKRYLTEQDQLSFGYMAIWLSSFSDALLHTVRHLYQLPMNDDLTPVGLHETMRATCGNSWGAHNGRRLLRFTALAKAKDRAHEFLPVLRELALRSLNRYKLR